MVWVPSIKKIKDIYNAFEIEGFLTPGIYPAFNTVMKRRCLLKLIPKHDVNGDVEAE